MLRTWGVRVRSSSVGLAMVLAAVATGCSGGEATMTEPTSPTTTVGSTASSSASGYDLRGRDVTAICAQLKVFADEWEEILPAGASEQEKREIARQGVVQMVAAADKLTTLAPPALAADIQLQSVALQRMHAQYMPSASFTAPPGPPKGANVVGGAQQRVNALAQSACGFKIWD